METRQVTERTPPRSTPREGFTLIEVVIAMVIMSGVVLTMALSTASLGRSTRASEIRNRAQALADMQIGRARAWSSYATLTQLSAAKYNGTADGLISSTSVSVDSASGKNLTTVRVTITSVVTGALASPVVRTVSIAP